MDWQPIETAPRDGTAILLFTQEAIGIGFIRDHLYHGMSLVDAPAAWAGPKPRETRIWLGGLDATDAKWWMPLPPPPVEGE